MPPIYWTITLGPLKLNRRPGVYAQIEKPACSKFSILEIVFEKMRAFSVTVLVRLNGKTKSKLLNYRLRKFLKKVFVGLG